MHVFFYGTLMAPARNPVARTIHARLGPGTPATTPGQLYAIPDPAGWYPALIPGEGVVHGQLHAADGLTAEDIARIDAWEGYDPAAPGGGDYARAALAVGDKVAQAYVWIAPLPPGAVPIPEGDFAAWLAHTGGRAFGE